MSRALTHRRTRAKSGAAASLRGRVRRVRTTYSRQGAPTFQRAYRPTSAATIGAAMHAALARLRPNGVFFLPAATDRLRTGSTDDPNTRDVALSCGLKHQKHAMTRCHNRRSPRPAERTRRACTSATEGGAGLRGQGPAGPGGGTPTLSRIALARAHRVRRGRQGNVLQEKQSEAGKLAVILNIAKRRPNDS